MKESDPMQTAKFAIAQWIDHAFNLWVNREVAPVTASQIMRNNKFGIELPKTVEQDLSLEAKSGNIIWAHVVAKELQNVKVTFKILPDGIEVPVGHLFVQFHMIFDIKMEDFRCKARCGRRQHE